MSQCTRYRSLYVFIGGSEAATALGYQVAPAGIFMGQELKNMVQKPKKVIVFFSRLLHFPF